MTRRPAALVAPPVARLLAFVLLAGLGVTQWDRYVSGAPNGRPVLWVFAGALSLGLVLLAARVGGRGRTPALIAAPLLGALVAVAVSGLELRYLEPNHWDELGTGLSRGMNALNTVKLPYTGAEGWVLTTVQLLGAGLCWAAGVLTAWPHGRGCRRAALILLLVLAAAPIVSLGGERTAVLGLALAVCVAAFLWLERLARRPGLGLVAVGVAALLIAVPVGRAADREQPLFDYKAFSERLSGGTPISFRWDHSYGPLNWPRDGAEMFRVVTQRPHYYKAETLGTFDGRRWVAAEGSAYGTAPETPLADDGRWNVRFRVSVRRLLAPEVMGSGTTLAVTDSSRPIVPAPTAGQFVAAEGKDFRNGDSYSVSARVPTPSPDELATSSSGVDPRTLAARTLLVPIQAEDARGLAEVTFPAFGSSEPVSAQFPPSNEREVDGARALEASAYARTWRLAQRLRERADSPWDYVRRVNDYLRSPRFVYSEDPPTSTTVQPLELFLFDSRRGYCQQFSGAMALLLRMGGVPTRVATGFTPGGHPPGSNEWTVRDTDAHSWVEVWFDDVGWVTVDPTPPDGDARSQVANLEPTPPRGGADTPRSAAEDAPRRAEPTPQRSDRAPRAVPTPDAPRATSGTSPLAWTGLGVLVLAVLAGAATVAAAQRPDTPERALAELETAMRRTGRRTEARTTLEDLERRLGASGYLRALSAARFGAGAPPTRAQRAGFRRDLVRGLGPAGRLRGWWALPPRPRTLRSRRPS